MDVVTAARRAIAFLGGMTLEELVEDTICQSAILYQLLILGEAVKRLSSDLREKFPQIPWRQVAGMRDVLIHRYDDIDLREVRDTVLRDLPKLVSELTPYLPALPF